MASSFRFGPWSVVHRPLQFTTNHGQRTIHPLQLSTLSHSIWPVPSTRRKQPKAQQHHHTGSPNRDTATQRSATPAALPTYQLHAAQRIAAPRFQSRHPVARLAASYRIGRTTSAGQPEAHRPQNLGHNYQYRHDALAPPSAATAGSSAQTPHDKPSSAISPATDDRTS